MKKIRIKKLRLRHGVPTGYPKAKPEGVTKSWIANEKSDPATPRKKYQVEIQGVVVILQPT